MSIQHNHLHLIVEAVDKTALSRGMQSFAINAARAINRVRGFGGKVFAHRYHASQIRSARYARSALACVMNNWRHHREDLATPLTRRAKLDPYASGLSFPGWTVPFARPIDYLPLPVSPPQTELLRRAWLRFGRIDPFEVPGRLR